MFTPLHPLQKTGAALGVELRVKRDDLLPGVGGGNKIRKIDYILRDVHPQCRALVTNGGIQSNHARVVALKAAELGWKCTLILHGDPSELDRPTGNLLLMLMAGAEVRVVPIEAMKGEINNAMASLEQEGAHPYNIIGGGHCVSGALAYCDAVSEIADQLEGQRWVPDVIVLPSGTGATQAGIAAGVQRLGWPTRVVGIAVGRPNPRGTLVVEQSCEELLDHLHLSPLQKPIEYRDQWLCGGYEKFNSHILDTIIMAAKMDGLILDTTYTGKAFTGLRDMVGNGEIPQGEKVLFWHTGGLLNLLSSSCFLERPDLFSKQ